MHLRRQRRFRNTLLVVAVLGAGPGRLGAQVSPAEIGHGLTAEQAREGRISLFDGKSTFGWSGAGVEGGALRGGTSTAELCDVALEGTAETAGTLIAGGRSFRVAPGTFSIPGVGGPATLHLGDGLRLRTLTARPLHPRTIFDGSDLKRCRVLHPERGTPTMPATWTPEGGWVRARGGPGALELPGEYADFVLQLDVRTRAPRANGGLFFRNPPGSFMMGYEAQIYNDCEEGDPARPKRYATGAIDDRQNARRLISRDGDPFVLTVLARGPHLATWVNGVQVADWTDTRPPDETPRKGLRLAAGTIQFQAHDPLTDVEFGRARIAVYGPPAEP